MGKLRSIQVLRAIAVLAVVYSHAFHSPRGTSGVDLFFVISGFIIARVSRDRPPLVFARARFFRIFPLYLAAAAPYVAWQLTHGSGITVKIAATLSLWPIWSGGYQEPLLPVAWSLYFEILFYAGVMLWLFSRRAAGLVAATIALSAAVHPGPVTYFLLSPIILEFAAGCALGRLSRFPLAAPAICLGLVLLFGPARGFEGETMLNAHQAGIRLLMFGVPAVMIVYGALGSEKMFAGRWADPLVRVGDASYSIYLTHLFAIHWLGDWPAIMKLLIAILFGMAVFTYVEHPSLQMVRQAGRRTSSRGGGVAPASARPSQA